MANPNVSRLSTEVYDKITNMEVARLERGELRFAAFNKLVDEIRTGGTTLEEYAAVFGALENRIKVGEKQIEDLYNIRFDPSKQAEFRADKEKLVSTGNEIQNTLDLLSAIDPTKQLEATARAALGEAESLLGRQHVFDNYILRAKIVIGANVQGL